MTMSEFLAGDWLTFEVKPAERNELMAMDNDEWTRTANHWRCILRRRPVDDPGEFTMEVPFSQGSAHTKPPELADVLDCLASDAASVENAKGFEDWASELGYEIDSRKAEKTYGACRTQAKMLRLLLGKKLYDTLLWEVERL